MATINCHCAFGFIVKERWAMGEETINVEMLAGGEGIMQ